MGKCIGVQLAFLVQSNYYYGMLKKINAYVEKYHMLQNGDTVVAGVSGGADSVCLLFMLHALQEEIPFTLYAVHINHGIREEAGEDASFVEELCNRLGVAFFLVEEDVAAIAKSKSCSAEEAGRQVRYAAFRQILCNETGVSRGRLRIAVAHNMNDRAETMLFNLFRGSGLKGLCSIQPIRRAKGEPDIIRPLLCVTRGEIEEYLTSIGEKWCIDRTNAEDTYTRNRIRHHILPYAEEAVAGGAVTNMVRAADILTETADFVSQETLQAYGDCVVSEKKEEIMLSAEEVLKRHVFLRKQLILTCLERLSPARRDITSSHVEAVLALFAEEGNREVYLPCQLVVRRQYDEVCFAQKREEPVAGAYLEEKMLPALKEDESAQILLSDTEILECKVFIYEKSVNIPQNRYTKWFDYDKIKKPLMVRTRRTGDYLTINETGSRKSIQDYMVDEKIPRQERDNLLLIAEESHILWVPGYRISSYYKIDENTKRILQVQLRGGQ